MRRSASEIVNELEDRIAKLEGKKAIAVVTLDGIEDHLRKALVATNRLGKRQSAEETLEYLKEEVGLMADMISGYLRQRRSASPKSPLAEKLRKAMPEGISVSVRRGTKGHNEVLLSWNPNNVYDDFGMTEEDYDYLGDNDLTTNELRVALKKAEKIIRSSVRDSVIEQDRRRSDMDQGQIVYNLL